MRDTQVVMAQRAPHWSYWRVLRNPRASVFLVGAVISQVGDGMIITALPLEALRIHGSVTPAVAVSLVQLAPYILATVLAFAIGLSPVRLPNRALLTVDCVLRLGLFTGLGLLGVTGRLNLWTLVLGLIVGSVLRLVATSSRRVVVVGMVPAEGRFAANGLVATSNSLALYVAGPVVGGLVSAFAQPSIALLANGLSFSALLVVTLATVPRLSTTLRGQRLPASGWRIIRHTPAVLRLFVVVFFFNFLYMPIEVALPLFVRDTLHGGGAALGAVWSAFGVGALIGAIAINWMRNIPRQILLVAVIAGWALCVLALGFATSVGFAAACFAVGGFIYAPFSATCFTFVQSLLSDDEQQPVVTLWTAGATIASPTGLAVGGLLVGAVGPMAGIIVSAIMTLVLVPLAGLGLSGRRVKAGKVDGPPEERTPADG
ncbi:MAG: MFS transporter [Actinomycetota bacterium]|nr:MFS transporter [Actinomycetota bacterium]